MNIKGLSTNDLKLLYTTIAKTLEDDDVLPARYESIALPFRMVSSGQAQGFPPA